MPLEMVVYHVLDFNYIIAPLRFIQGFVRTIFGQRPWMSPDSSTLRSLPEGPKQVHVPCDFRVALETVIRSPSSASIYLYD